MNNILFLIFSTYWVNSQRIRSLENSCNIWIQSKKTVLTENFITVGQK